MITSCYHISLFVKKTRKLGARGRKVNTHHKLRNSVVFWENLTVWLPSKKAMAPHSSTLAWRIPWMEEPGGLQSMGSLESDTTERLHFHFSLSCIGEGNGNPLQCSCLENPRDGGAQWAAVYGVAQSRTRLKQLGRQQQHGYLATAHAHTLLNIILTIYTS